MAVGLGFAFWLCVLIAARLQSVVPVSNLTRDPAVVAHFPIYYGALSNIGILFWSGSVAACLVGVMLLKVLQPNSDAVKFFTAYGGFSLVLCLDDLFLFHEKVFPERILAPLGLNLDEEILLIAYAVTFVVLLFRFRKILLQTKPALFGLSLLMFAMSIAFDVLPFPFEMSSETEYFLEDGSKLLAIFVWFTYFVWAAVELITISVKAMIAQSIELNRADSKEQGDIRVASPALSPRIP
ncbi:MAG: hypothetical protein WBA76_01215 [Phormidesmis sp.]